MRTRSDAADRSAGRRRSHAGSGRDRRSGRVLIGGLTTGKYQIMIGGAPPQASPPRKAASIATASSGVQVAGGAGPSSAQTITHATSPLAMRTYRADHRRADEALTTTLNHSHRNATVGSTCAPLIVGTDEMASVVSAGAPATPVKHQRIGRGPAVQQACHPRRHDALRYFPLLRPDRRRRRSNLTGAYCVANR